MSAFVLRVSLFHIEASVGGWDGGDCNECRLSFVSK
jgi:hypothetical protein